MAYKLRIIFLLAVGILVLIPGLASAQDGSAFDFPEVEGWKKGEIIKYPRDFLGSSVTYESEEGGKVTLYFYDGDVPKIPDGANNLAVKAQMKQAEGEIKIFADRGYYQNVKKVSSGKVKLGGDEGSVEALHSNYNIEIRGAKLTSDIFLFGKNNLFIKIRATRTRGDGSTPNKAFDEFLAAMDELFAE